MGKKVADIIVETLQAAGVRHCYGIPGDTLNFFTDAVRRSSIRWVHVRHEEAGAFAAGAESYVTNTLTACAGSCGPGSLHFINGIFEAHRNGAPVVLIASQVHQDQLSFDFPQEVDLKAVYASCSVYCDQISTATQAQRKTTLAIQAALNKRGVAVLILPVDVAEQAAPKTVGADFTLHRVDPCLTPSGTELDLIARMLNDGAKVTIYGGIGCKDAHDEVVELGRKLNAPIARTSRAKDFLEPHNPHDVGMIGMFGHASGVHALNTCDTLLILGSDFAWKQFYPSEARIIQIDRDCTHLGRRHPVTLGAVGDVKSTVAALLPLIQQKADRQFLDDCRKRYKESVDYYDERAKPTKSGEIHPQYVVRLLDQLADDDAIFTADVGSPMVWLLRHITANGKRRTLTSLLHGTMANAMPQALGLKVACPDRQVISLSGDGGFSMLLGDLLTAVQENIPIKMVVLNNESLFFVELEQRMEGLLDSYTTLTNPDFAKVAEAVGIWSRRVENCDDLKEAVEQLLAHPGPGLLDVKVVGEITMPPYIGFRQVKGIALYSMKAIIGGRSDDLITMVKENL